MPYISKHVWGDLATYEKKKLIGKNQTINDMRSVNAMDLAQKIEDCCNELEKDGYEVISIFPLNHGYYDYKGVDAGISGSGGGYGYGYGVTPTKGAIITARKS